MSGWARRRVALLSAFSLIISVLSAFAAIPAFATHTGTTFAIDGDTTGPNDWTTAIAQYNVISATDLCGNGVSEDRVVASTKLDDPWPLETGPVTSKGDLCRVWSGFEELPDGDIVFLFAWERFANTGTVNIYVPLEDTLLPGRNGDQLFKFAYDSDNKSVQVSRLQWNGTAWVSVGAALDFDSAVSADTRFAEVALNLNDAGILPNSSTSCTAVLLGDVITETGQDTANPTLKDFVLLPPITLDNCATVTVSKVTSPAGLTGPFPFTLAGPGAPRSGSLAQDGSSVVYEDVVGGTYALTEDLTGLPFSLDSIVCDGVDVTNSTFEVARNGEHSCVITNVAQPGTITIEKTVITDDGGTLTAADFQGYIDGEPSDWFVAYPASVGSHTVSEDTETGYVAGAWGGDCAAGGSVYVGPGENVVCTIVNDDVPLTVDLTKVASPGELPEPGGEFSFTLTITNPNAEAVEITSLIDSQSGSSADFATECGSLVGQTLAAGGSTSCTYHVSHSAPAVYDNEASVTVGSLIDGRTASDDDVASVEVTDVPSSITVVKTADPTSVNEPGADVTFTVTVTNNSTIDTVTIDTLTDSVYGDLDGEGSCTVPQELAPLGSYQCSFTEFVAGQAGDPDHQNVVTASGQDDDGQPVSDEDDAVVTILDVPSGITVTKTPSQDVVSDPGGTVEFTVTIVNDSAVDTVTITSMDDDVYGDLTALAGSTCSLPQVLAVGGSYTCTFTDFIDADHLNTVTAEGTDDDGTPVSDSDSAAVEYIPIPSSIQVTKTPNVGSVTEPGGVVTFTVAVQNTSAVDTVFIDSLVDDVFGDIADAANPAVESTTCAIPVGGIVLVPTDAYVCSFDAFIEGQPADGAHVNVVTGSGVDDDGEVVSDDDDASVTFTNAVPVIAVDKVANPTSVDEPGGVVTFTVTVTNTVASVEPVTLIGLDDDQFGDVFGLSSECAALQGTVLAVGASVQCSFDELVSGDAGDVHTNVVTATAVDDEQTEVTAQDDADVDILDVLPVIAVTKTANPTSVVEPGAPVTFTVEVENLSVEAVTVSSLVDDMYGDLDGQGTCAVPQTLGVGGTYTCAFTQTVNGNAGDVHTNVVTAVATDNDGNQAEASDDAVVLITDLASSIEIVKTALQSSVDEPGAVVTFHVEVFNTSVVDSLTINTLIDSVYGDLGLLGDCVALIGETLTPGTSVDCTFEGEVYGNAGDVHINVVTVGATDDDGQPLSDEDDAVVTIGDVASSIEVVKTALQATVEEPGAMVEFQVDVTNTSPVDSLTIDSLVDDVYGDLATLGDCGDLIDVTLEPGQSMSCSFQGMVSGVPGDLHVNVVTVEATDDDGAEVSDDDDAVVEVLDVPSAVTVDKTPSVGSVLAPGGPVTFTVVVTNTSTVDVVTITSLVDDIYGDLDGVGTCALGEGMVLQPGESFECSFEAMVEGAEGDSHINVVTAAGTDDDDVDVEASDDATVLVGENPGVIGDYVWFDADKDGIQDADELGLAGVTVELLDGNGGLVASTMTDADGLYIFEGVPAGTYRVRFIATPGFTGWSPLGLGGDSALDSDVTKEPGSGTDLQAGSAITAAFVLGLGEVNDDIDAGLVVEVEDVVVTTTTTIPPVTTDTLPFTGFQAGAIALFGLLVAAGGLLLLVTTRPVGAHESRDKRPTVTWANTR